MCAPSHHMVPARTHPTELVPSYRPRATQLSDPPFQQQVASGTPTEHGHARRSTGASSNRFSTWQPPDIPTEIGRRDTQRIKWTPAISITNGGQSFTIRCQREHIDTIWRRATTHWRTDNPNGMALFAGATAGAPRHTNVREPSTVVAR